MNKRLTILSTLFVLILTTVLSSAFLFSGKTYATGTLYVYQDMDNTTFPPAGWTLTNTGGYNWIRTTYASGYGQGLSSAMCDFYDYNVGATFDMFTNTFASSTANDSLVFDHAYAPATSENDRLDIYTSTDGGATWTMLISLAGGASGPLRTGTATQHLFVPTAATWATKRYALPTGTNKIKFEGVSAFGNNLYLDNIRIGSIYTTDVGMSSIVAPKWGIIPQTTAPVLNIRNYGTSTQTFTVTMTATPGGYTSTQNVTALAPGAVTTVTFPTNTFAAGTYTLKAFTNLAGDQNRTNDTITNTLVVTQNKRNIVLEYCTGTWCQWCPCGDREVQHVDTAFSNSVILAYHGASTDPWKNFNGNGIINLLGFAGYPSGVIDRRMGPINNGWGSFYTDAELRYSQAPEATVNLTTVSSSYDPVTKQLSVNMNATALQNLTGTYKYSFIISESNMIYVQTGNSYCPGASNWVHDDVVRNIVNGTSGTLINSGTWNNGQMFPLTLTTTFDSTWIPTNCKFKVLVYKDSSTLSFAEVQQGIASAFITPIGVEPIGTRVPAAYSLGQNYPNPFNPTSNIHFSIPKDGIASLKIYNMLGQEIAVYLDGFIKAGNYNAEVDMTNFASGTYFYTLSAGDFVETKKMVLTK